MRVPLKDPLHREKGFTLIELLTVLAVIIMLVALVAANMGDLGSSRNLANGGSLLRGLVDQARQTARSHNSMTMLVGRLDGDDGGRLFTLLERRSGSAAWQQISKWERLPDGISLDREESEIFVQSATDTTTLARPTLKHGAAQIQPSQYGYAVFLPGGRLYASTAEPPVLYLKHLQAGEDPKNYYKIVINPMTGVPHVKRP